MYTEQIIIYILHFMSKFSPCYCFYHFNILYIMKNYIKIQLLKICGTDIIHKILLLAFNLLKCRR